MLKKILKIVLSLNLMILPILSIRLASTFVDIFCPYFGYEKMKIGSRFIPGVVIIVLLLVLVILFKMWAPDFNEHNHED